MEPLRGQLVVDLSRLLPGAFASRALLRLGARVVRLEPPDGDPLRHLQTAWHEELNGGKAPLDALKASLDRLTGAYALVLMVEGEDDLILGARRGPAQTSSPSKSSSHSARGREASARSSSGRRGSN